MSPRLVSAGLAFLFLSSGCNTVKSPPPRGESALSSAAPDAATQPAEADDPITRPQALAWKTEAYAREMLAKTGPRTRPTTAPVDPLAEIHLPEIRWIDPKAFSLTLGPRQDPAGPHPSRPEIAPEAPPATQPANPEPIKITSVSLVPHPAPAAPQAVAPTADQLEQKLAQQIRDYPRDLSFHLDYQLLQVLHGRPAPQLEAVASLPAEDREVLSALIDALSNFRSTVRGEENVMLVRKVRPLMELSDRLRAQADLRIPTVVLCTRVDGFGVYEPIEAPQFQAGREHAVIVYCEVENFVSQFTDRKQWTTSLSQDVVLYGERGQRVWDDKRRAVTDQSRNRRHDFFVVRMLRIPASLPPGQYYLKISISDQHSGRIAEASVPIQIAGDKSLVSSH